MKAMFVKVKNRHGFTTVHAGNTVQGAESPLRSDGWTVCHRDPDGEPWAWARLATQREAREWLRQGNRLGEWVEA
jgi:hypothetical protein